MKPLWPVTDFAGITVFCLMPDERRVSQNTPGYANLLSVNCYSDELWEPLGNVFNTLRRTGRKCRNILWPARPTQVFSTAPDSLGEVPGFARDEQAFWESYESLPLPWAANSASSRRTRYNRAKPCGP